MNMPMGLLSFVKNSILGIIVLSVAIFSGWKIGVIGIPIGGLVLEVYAPDNHDTQSIPTVSDDHKLVSGPPLPTLAKPPKELPLSDVLMTLADLPSGTWNISQGPIEVSDLVLSTLVDYGGLSFVCQKSTKIKTSSNDFSIKMANITAISQDLPPQQFQEWILQANERLYNSDIFEVLKASLHECEGHTFIEENNSVRHTFTLTKLLHYGNEVYALREEVEPLTSSKDDLALYRGTGFVVLVRDNNTVFYIYYMTGHSLFRHSQVEQANSVIASAVERLSVLDKEIYQQR